MLNRIVRDGLVAVICSDAYGAGWHSHHGIDSLLFDPEIVAMIESDKSPEHIHDYCLRTYSDFHVGYSRGVELRITWIPVGVQFRISEYDGLEHVVYRTQDEYHTA